MYLFIGCREDGGAEDGPEAGSDDKQADMLAMFDELIIQNFLKEGTVSASEHCQTSA